ncbi:DUF1697 domain-containing protein [Kordiimonas sp. SCSIO 12603]|uniref:DUF1697 domain-containing protein n=1 Tax=Kordiimonas sp. SCSIO 12603 TaxID=2829596 RepID=UPI0021044CBF|nr:DUF1697 domain-containing protein [Kordiimonas sp. SCSIO 12603]UTW58579.1 DUF1697 domain-containing protein [Kordiimonas sp. SCSIO 12603]
MTVWIVLLRGVNVGGGKNNTIIMKDFKVMLEGLGYKGVKTYIQSGNAVFSTSGTSAGTIKQEVGEAIERTFGFLPQIMVLKREAFRQKFTDNPFPQAEDEPKTLMICFLEREPDAPNFDNMKELQADTEEFQLKGDTFYFYAPKGIGRSKLAEKLERLLGVPVTARNLRSVGKILELAEVL